MGVQLFGGRYHKCLDAEGNKINASIVPNRTICELHEHDLNYSWENSKINFDNAGAAYLALFQVVSTFYVYQV